MNEDAVKLWVLKAENDLKTGKDELSTINPATDTICFHAQQCVEKYLKAFLVHDGKEITKTHNISMILVDCKAIDPEFSRLSDENVDELSIYAVDTRYPDDFYMPTFEEAQSAIRLAETVKEFVAARIRSAE
jgi:HEPN domain-containing protein